MSRDNKTQFEKFCVDDILNEDNFPYCIVYLYNKHPSGILNIGDRSKRGEIQNIADKHRFKSWMPSASSILFFNSEDVSSSSRTLIFELFYNFSMKLHIPLTPLPNALSRSVAEDINKRNAKIDVSNFKAIDGFLSYNSIKSLYEAAFSILIEKEVSFENYILKSELKNVYNSYLFFATRNDEWCEFVCKKGFRYSTKDSISPIIFSSENLCEDELETRSGVYAFNSLAFPFGYFIDEFFEFLELNRKHANTFFPDHSYTNRDYYGRLFGTEY